MKNEIRKDFEKLVENIEKNSITMIEQYKVFINQYRKYLDSIKNSKKETVDSSEYLTDSGNF